MKECGKSEECDGVWKGGEDKFVCGPEHPAAHWTAVKDSLVTFPNLCFVHMSSDKPAMIHHPPVITDTKT